MKRSPIIAPHRGTIVLDAGAFFRLSGEVEPQFIQAGLGDKHHIHHYVGALEYLAKLGFKIVIPEMVALESAGVLADGTSLQYHLELFSEPAGFSKLSASMFQRVAEGKYPGIKIIPTKTPDKKDQNQPQYVFAMNAIKNIAKTHQSHINNHQKECSCAREYINWKKWFKDKRDYGDKAISHYVEEHFKTQAERENVFVLTNDHGLMQSLADQCQGVNVMDVNGLLNALLHSEHREMLGLREDAALKEMDKSIANQWHEKISKNKKADGDKKKRLYYGRWVDASTHNANVANNWKAEPPHSFMTLCKSIKPCTLKHDTIKIGGLPWADIVSGRIRLGEESPFSEGREL